MLPKTGEENHYKLPKIKSEPPIYPEPPEIPTVAEPPYTKPNEKKENLYKLLEI